MEDCSRLARSGAPSRTRRNAMKPAPEPVPEPDDLARIAAWFERLAEHVRAVDFAGARPLFAIDMIAFGTFTDFVDGRDDVEAAQWRNVCPFIAGSPCRPASLPPTVSPPPPPPT